MKHPLKAMFASAFEAGAVAAGDQAEKREVAFEAWCEAYLGVPSVLDSVALDRLGYEWRQRDLDEAGGDLVDQAMLDLVADLLAATGRIKPPADATVHLPYEKGGCDRIDPGTSRHTNPLQVTCPVCLANNGLPEGGES